LVTDDGHDIGLAEFVVYEPTVSGLRLKQFQPNNRLLCEAFDRNMSMTLRHKA